MNCGQSFSQPIDHSIKSQTTETNIMKHFFPFGRPVLECNPEITGKPDLFVLGAYPSALHVAWQPPEPYKGIKAIAVDNEPEVFWDGSNQEKLIDMWKDSVGYESSWGSVTSAGNLNGSSGIWVNENILKPLGATREETFLTDCLNTYRASDRGFDRIQDTYAPFATKCGLPQAFLLPHPGEDDIVSESLAHHKDRLIQQIQAVHPKKIATLGNAALRVLGQLITATKNLIPNKLSSKPEEYGKCLRIDIDEIKDIEWWPLAHPASPLDYQDAHKRWINNR